MQLVLAAWIVVATIVVSRSDASSQVVSGAESFANNFVRAVSRVEDGNYVVSPVSVSSVLGMLAYGAAGQTAVTLKAALSLPQDRNAAKKDIQNFIYDFSTYKDVELLMANKIYFSYHVSPKAPFLEMVTQAYRSETEDLDFLMPDFAAREINAWCRRNTKNRITNVIDPAKLTPETSMVLVNAVYFKGSWEDQFNPELTQDKTFYVNGRSPITVPTMYREGFYRYGEFSHADFRFVEIPYKRKNVSMFVLLPNKRDGLERMEESLGDSLLFDLLNNRRSGTVQIHLPKFQFETKIELVDPLVEMGLGEIFLGDYSNIVDFPPLRVSQAVQKAFISVDETGSEAAAVTSMQLENKFGSDDDVFKFEAKYPFLAIIATTGPSPTNLFTIRYTGV